MVPTRPANVAVFESTTKLVLCNQEDRFMADGELIVKEKLASSFCGNLVRKHLDDGWNGSLQIEPDAVTSVKVAARIVENSDRPKAGRKAGS
jgi:hypothetical protein